VLESIYVCVCILTSCHQLRPTRPVFQQTPLRARDTGSAGAESRRGGGRGGGGGEGAVGGGGRPSFSLENLLNENTEPAVSRGGLDANQGRPLIHNIRSAVNSNRQLQRLGKIIEVSREVRLCVCVCVCVCVRVNGVTTGRRQCVCVCV